MRLWAGHRAVADCHLHTGFVRLTSCTVIRAIFAYVLALVLTVTGFSFAQARGVHPDMGMEMVICTGVGMTTITVGPDGAPIETNHVCPDAAQSFVAAFALPVVLRPEARLVGVVTPQVTPLVGSHQELSPSARGPPALV